MAEEETTLEREELPYKDEKVSRENSKLEGGNYGRART